MTTHGFRDYELPQLSRPRPNLVAASFFLMKLLPARTILDGAIARGELRPGMRVVESTSGTFGLALAMLAKAYDFQLTLVSDPVIDPFLKARLDELGVTTDIVTTPGEGGYQRARIARVQALLAEYAAQGTPAYFPHQYNNPDNLSAYHTLADNLAQRLGTIDMLVGTVGTGGSMCGTAQRLRQLFPNIRIVGIDTPNSILFGQPDGKRLLRGLGNSLLPQNVDHSLFDEIHWVPAADAFAATRHLHSHFGLFRGPTSGAAWLVANHLAQQHPTQTIVTLLPDDGTRYQDSVYQTAWCESIPGWTGRLPTAPHEIQNPTAPLSGWSHYPWARQTLASMLAQHTRQAA